MTAAAVPVAGVDVRPEPDLGEVLTHDRFVCRGRRTVRCWRVVGRHGDGVTLVIFRSGLRDRTAVVKHADVIVIIIV